MERHELVRPDGHFRYRTEAFLHATASATAGDPKVQRYVREVNAALTAFLDEVLASAGAGSGQTAAGPA